MKNHIKKIAFLGLLFISLCILIIAVSEPRTAKADSVITQSEDPLEENIEEQLKNLDLSDLEEYLKSFDGFSEGESIGELLIKYIRGGDFDYEKFGEEFLQIFLRKVLKILPSFAVIAAIAILSGLLSTVKSSMNAQTASDMISILTYLAALIPLLAILLECFNETKSGILSMRKQMELIYPLLLTLMAASGASVSAAVCRPAVGFFSTSIVSVIDSVILPMTITIIVLSMCGHFSKTLKIGKFSAFFKSMNKWLIGICVSAFGIFFTLQGITSAVYDGVIRRAAKYAIGNGIPIVGGFLSGGFDLAVAGSVLIKNSLGSMGIFLMLSVLLEPLILLVSVNLMLRLISAITQPFGDSQISDFLGETAENMHYCTASLLITAFLYFLTIVLMIYSTEALF